MRTLSPVARSVLVFAFALAHQLVLCHLCFVAPARIHQFLGLPGPGIRMGEVRQHPESFAYLFREYGLREEDEDDGEGDAAKIIDFADAYRFPGLWNICG